MNLNLQFWLIDSTKKEEWITDQKGLYIGVDIMTKWKDNRLCSKDILDSLSSTLLWLLWAIVFSLGKWVYYYCPHNIVWRIKLEKGTKYVTNSSSVILADLFCLCSNCLHSKYWKRIYEKNNNTNKHIAMQC